jgi:hypothetical protein
MTGLTANTTLIQSILNFKIIPDTNTLKNINLFPSKHYPSNQILELLIKYGLIVTLDDIGYMLYHQYVLTNLERFNIPYDKELYFVCSQYDFFPDEYQDKFTIDKNILHLHKMCKTNSFDEIVTFMKDNNLKLDKFCMEFLLDNSDTFDKILEKYKCMPHIYSMYKHHHKLKLTKMAIEQFNITADTMFEQYDMTP